jgi:hypothetical protein
VVKRRVTQILSEDDDSDKASDADYVPDEDNTNDDDDPDLRGLECSDAMIEKIRDKAFARNPRSKAVYHERVGARFDPIKSYLIVMDETQLALREKDRSLLWKKARTWRQNHGFIAIPR